MTFPPNQPTVTRSALPRGVLAACLCAGLTGPALAQDAREELEVSFVSAEGADIGTATLTGTPNGLLIELDLRDLPPGGWHGFHIHENGVCDAEDAFGSAGDHFSASDDAQHGYYAEGGPHPGDMPNQYVAADGTLKAEVFNSYVSLGGAEADVTGRSLILHSGPDDYESRPAGESGDRIACAVIG